MLIVLFANFIEMLLPNSKFRGYIRVIIGFFVILVIIVPFIEMMNFKKRNINLSLFRNNPQQSLEKILTTGNRLRQREIESKGEEYKQKLKKQLTAVIKLNSELNTSQIEILFDKKNKVKKIIINTKDEKIAPVQIDLKQQKEDKKKKQMQKHQHLKQLLVSIYGFDKEQIEVR